MGSLVAEQGIRSGHNAFGCLHCCFAAVDVSSDDIRSSMSRALEWSLQERRVGKAGIEEPDTDWLRLFVAILSCRGKGWLQDMKGVVFFKASKWSRMT